MTDKVKAFSTSTIKNYLLVGVLAFGVEYLVFLALFSVISNLLLAQSLSFITGLIVSFLGNRRVTFAKNDASFHLGSRSQFVSYAVLALANLILTNTAIYLLTYELGTAASMAKIAVMIMVVLWNYLIFNKIIFKTK